MIVDLISARRTVIRLVTEPRPPEWTKPFPFFGDECVRTGGIGEFSAGSVADDRMIAAAGCGIFWG
jgi:hypothetical protein